jgi:hypothetical protein
MYMLSGGWSGRISRRLLAAVAASKAKRDDALALVDVQYL